MALSRSLVQCPIIPCDSWYPPGAPYKRHLELAHAEREYLNPSAQMIVNLDPGLEELDEVTSIGSDLMVRWSMFSVLLMANTI